MTGKVLIRFSAVFLLLSGCQQRDARVRENTLLVYQQTSDSNFCAEDFVRTRDCGNGEFYLTGEGKALYTSYCLEGDSIIYYRGRYSYTDTLVTCIFDSRLVTGPEESAGKKRFSDAARQTIYLKPTGCEPDRFVLYTVSMGDRTKERSFTIFRSARSARYAAFCRKISAIPALIDFHCEYEPDTVSHEREDLLLPAVNSIIDHYKALHPKTRITRHETDSSFELSFIAADKRRRLDDSPDLLLRIYKTEKGWMHGDLNNDTISDLLAIPVLSQGGNSSWQELFAFVSENDRYRLRAVTSAFELATCAEGSYNGVFVPARISAGVIEGESRCYTDDDEACCPSVKVKTKVKLQDRQLKALK